MGHKFYNFQEDQSWCSPSGKMNNKTINDEINNIRTFASFFVKLSRVSGKAPETL